VHGPLSGGRLLPQNPSSAIILPLATIETPVVALLRGKNGGNYRDRWQRGNAFLVMTIDMHPRRSLVAGLTAAHAVLHVVALPVALGAIDRVGKLSDLFTYAFFMLGPSQSALLALWVVLGGGRAVWRLLAVALGVIAYFIWIENLNREWLSTTLGELAACATVLVAARLAGLRLAIPAEPLDVRGRPQFHIRDVLIWTAATALVLGLLRCVPDDRRLFPLIPNIITVLGSLTVVATASIYAPLGKGRTATRVALALLAIGLGSALLVASIRSHSFWYYVFLLSLMAAWIVGSLLVVRRAGYRLAWQWRFERHHQDGTGVGGKVAASEPSIPA